MSILTYRSFSRRIASEIDLLPVSPFRVLIAPGSGQTLLATPSSMDYDRAMSTTKVLVPAR
jgi:hypothetical protein